MLQEALAKEEELARKVQGYKDELIGLQTASHLTPGQASSASQATVKTLTKLEEQRKLLQQLILEASGKEGADASKTEMNKEETPAPVRPKRQSASHLLTGATGHTREDLQNLNHPVLVIIRHGKTEHNKLGLFTGWEVCDDVDSYEYGNNNEITVGCTTGH